MSFDSHCALEATVLLHCALLQNYTTACRAIWADGERWNYFLRMNIVGNIVQNFVMYSARKRGRDTAVLPDNVKQTGRRIVRLLLF
jgi:hypothetical protein